MAVTSNSQKFDVVNFASSSLYNFMQRIYISGTASVARAFSMYFDSLIGGHIQEFFKEHFPMHVTTLSDYPDFFAFGITLVLTGEYLKVGSKHQSHNLKVREALNSIFKGLSKH